MHSIPPGLLRFATQTQLRDYQRDAVNAALSFCDAPPPAKRMFVMPTGCHARGSQVLLACGKPIDVEAVAVGDELAGVDGPRRVLKLHRGRQTMARITPTEGEPFVVNLDHTLTLQRTAPHLKKHWELGLVDITVRWWCELGASAKSGLHLVRYPAWWGGGKERPEALGYHPSLLHFAVDLLPEDDYFGFEVDGDHRYLMADLTLTHNSGKGTCQLMQHTALRAQGRRSWIVTPSPEVLAGYLERCHVDIDTLNDAQRADAAMELCITTPLRMRNRLTAGEFPELPPEVLIVDECFPGSTLVGGRRIDSLCPGDSVPSFDPGTLQPVHRRVVRVIKKTTATLVKVEHERGVLHCTPNHEIFTKVGWKAAGDLTSSDSVLHITHASAIASSASGDYVQLVRYGGNPGGQSPVGSHPQPSAVLFQSLPQSPERKEGIRADESYQEGTPGPIPQAAEDLGCGVHGVRAGSDFGGLRSHPNPEERSALLLQGVHGCHREPRSIREDGQDQSTLRVGANESEEPHAQAGDQSQGRRYAKAHRACASGAGRQRDRAHQARGGHVPGSGLGASDGGNRSIPEGQPLASADSLQDRRRGRRFEDRHRDRRPIALSAQAAGTGCEEGRIPAWSRVGSVQVLEPGGDGEFERLCPGGEVFDLEVEETHTYVADGVGVHNCHHSIADNSVAGYLFAVLPYSVFCGWTATGFRGTPRGTQKLREEWGEPVELMTWTQAVGLGCVSMPYCQLRPLVDDDKIKVANGEFVTGAASAAYAKRIDHLHTLIESFKGQDGRYDKPTLVTVPSTEVAQTLREMGHAAILQDTTRAERVAIFERCAAGETAIVFISVLAEGVDIPWARRLIDARPLQSPVLWRQIVGRVTRPGPIEPEYICTNRNIERHGYLFGGMLPRSVVREAQTAFGEPSLRAAGMRHCGLEAIERFKRIPVPLADGTQAVTCQLYSVEPDGTRYEWFVAFLPTGATLTAKRTTTRGPKGEYLNGKWQLAELPSEEAFTGFATSTQRGKLSPKMREWWERDALKCGLDPRAADAISRRQFQLLPVLLNTGMRIT